MTYSVKTGTDHNPSMADIAEPTLHLLLAEMVGLASLIPAVLTPGGLQPHAPLTGEALAEEDAAFDNMPV